MTTIISACVRLFTAAALALVLAIAVSPGVEAQPCSCDAIRIESLGIGCPITLYAAAPLCRFAPVTITSSTKPTFIACCDDMSLTFYGCNGASFTFQQGGPTSVTDFPIQPGCCVDAILFQDPVTGCITIRFRASQGLCAC